jgi:very-short-patch-repair endonuclease
VGVHGTGCRPDALSDAKLQSLGLRVLRFTNRDVKRGIDGVLDTIEAALLNRL